VVLAEKGQLLIDLPHYEHEARFKQSVNVKGPVRADQFVVRAPAGADKVTVNVIGVIENQAPTRHLTAELAVVDGQVQPDLQNDVLRVALVERHRGTGEIVNAFVSGFGFNAPCAMAATIAHDSHHMLVVGTSEEDMALAVNTLAEVGGGVAIMREGELLALVELPIGGLMSDERAEVVAEKSARMLAAMRDCGCTLHNGNMQLFLLALVVIPELRISDLGLVDVTTFQHIPVVVQ
jgi:adenine deaminase